MIEPSVITSPTPVIDDLTRKMTAAWRKRKDSNGGYRGWHQCRCGAISDNKDHWVGDHELLTNSLCIHYLAFHRNEVSTEELAKVRALPDEQEEPNEQELVAPRIRSHEPPRTRNTDGLPGYDDGIVHGGMTPEEY